MGHLNDILFREAEIIKTIEMREHIFEMKDQAGNSLGFVSLYDLKDYVIQNEQESAQYFIRNIDAASWVNIFEHQLFQRRKPQLVSSEAFSTDNDLTFFILKDGQKTGPFEKAELVAMLEKKDLLLTDMVSYNGGHTWMKLYQIGDFDRRVLKKSDMLPGAPKKVIERPLDRVVGLLPDIDAISNLDYLRSLKYGRKQNRAEGTEVPLQIAQSNALYKWIFVASLVGVGCFLYILKSQLVSPFKNHSPAIGEQPEVLTPVETPEAKHKKTVTIPTLSPVERPSGQVNDQRRTTPKFEARRLEPIKPLRKKSFMETEKYQEIKYNDDPPEDNNNYYYEQATAIELQPSAKIKPKAKNNAKVVDPEAGSVDGPAYSEGADAGEGGPIPSSDPLFENEVNNQN